MIEDDIPGSSQTKTVKIDKGPSDTKSIADDEVPGTWVLEGSKEDSSSRKNIPKKLTYLKINLK